MSPDDAKETQGPPTSHGTVLPGGSINRPAEREADSPVPPVVTSSSDSIGISVPGEGISPIPTTEPVPASSVDSMFPPQINFSETHVPVDKASTDNSSDAYEPSPPNSPTLDNTIRPEEAHTDRTTNIQKAEVMAHAENEARDTDAAEGRFKASERTDYYDYVTNRVGDDYELESIAKRDGKTVEEVRELIENDTDALVEYGRRIIDNHEKYGEKLTPEQQVFLAICNFLDKLKDNAHSRHAGNNKDKFFYFIGLSSSTTRGSIALVRLGLKGSLKFQESWSASPMTEPDKMGTYTREEDGRNEDFDSIVRIRVLRQEDADNLTNLIADFEPVTK